MRLTAYFSPSSLLASSSFFLGTGANSKTQKNYFRPLLILIGTETPNSSKQSTLIRALLVFCSKKTSMVDANLGADAFSEHSRSCYVIMLNGGIICMKIMKQTVVARSTGHSEMIAFRMAGYDTTTTLTRS